MAELNAALSNPRADLAIIDELERTLFSLNYAVNEVGSLGEVIDPARATRLRSEALALLQESATKALCSPDVGDALERLKDCPELLDDTRQAQLKILRRDRAALVDVPVAEQTAFNKLRVEAYDVWRDAKAAGDWESFAPYLDRIVAAMKSMASYKDPSKEPYDVWLDEFEHGSSCVFYDAFFEQIKACVVPLLADCMASRRKPSAACLEGSFDETRQWKLAEDLVKLEGIDEDALWLGKTEHPFTGGPSGEFVIIASHAYPKLLLSNVFSMLHEGGHTLYEQGVDPVYAMTSLHGGTSMGMHEAQSRFFENIVGRSEAFSEPLLACLRKHFPGQMNRVTAHQLYQAENVAEPGLIRTEADELTYPLHILVRYEIEQALFSGEATAADVPALWAQKYKSYLGLDVPNHTVGALQDMHWSDGSIGYFPTYALGSAFGAQFKAAMVREGMDFDGVCASGDLAPIREWLGSRIWRWGRAKDSDQLVREATGEVFSPVYYTDYLTEKFTRLYGL